MRDTEQDEKQDEDGQSSDDQAEEDSESEIEDDNPRAKRIAREAAAKPIDQTSSDEDVAQPVLGKRSGGPGVYKASKLNPIHY